MPGSPRDYIDDPPASQYEIAADSLWVEGEHIPESRIADVFQAPPEIPAKPTRSALLIGSRGAGKTTFLRHLARVHPGVSIELSLSADLASISQELPVGFLSVDSEPGEEESIVGKAVSLAAVRMAERAVEQGIEIDPGLLLGAMPPGFMPRRPRPLSSSSLRKVRIAIDRADLEQFGSLAKGRVLQQFAAELGKACTDQGRGPLLLLSDRGDNVVPACLAAIFQLLDQSDSYTAITAMRPGPSPSPALVDTPASAAAGDHFDVLALGNRPRSLAWQEFVRQSLLTQPQLKEVLQRLDSATLDRVLLLSRDSVRTAISVLGRVHNAPVGQADFDAVLDGFHNVAENLQLSTKKLLRQFNPDPTALLRELRRDLLQGGSAPGAPFLLSVASPRQRSLLETTTDLDRLIAVGLRCGAFCLPEGTVWAPGDRPLEIEVNPLVLWRREDGLPNDPGKEIEIHKKSTDLLGNRGGPPKTSIFCAYRMQRESSVKFLSDLSREVRRHPALSSARVTITNGKTAPGQNWAKTIRNRISKAKAVVADVTEMRPDVIFEAGFAYGHSKPIIPAAETSVETGSVPRWLTDRQTAVFTEKNGLAGIITGLITILNDPGAARRGPPKPAPGKIVWLRTLPWNRDALEQVRGACRHEGMVLEIYRSPEDSDHPGQLPAGTQDLPVEELIEKAARAHLLIVSLDGTNGDDLMHYVAGAVAAKPKTSSDGAGRKVLVLNKPELPINELVADSLTRVTEVVRLITMDQVRPEVAKFAESYQRWSTQA